jgi:hypothetical protein
MTTPSKDNLLTMDYAYLGVPFVNVQTKDSQTTSSLDFAYLGLPFVGAYNSFVPPSTFDATRMFLIF